MVYNQTGVKAINHYPEYNIFVSWKSEPSTPKQQISPLLMEPVTARPQVQPHLLPLSTALCEWTGKSEREYKYKLKSSAWGAGLAEGAVAWHGSFHPGVTHLMTRVLIWWSSLHITKNLQLRGWTQGQRAHKSWKLNFQPFDWPLWGSGLLWGQACFSRNHIHYLQREVRNTRGG